jgi:hypothetical protein
MNNSIHNEVIEFGMFYWMTFFDANLENPKRLKRST